MFRQNLNRARLSFRIQTVTPLLIKAGDAGLAPGVPDLSCVRTRVAGADATVYIPGSSLKGVVRSTVEALLRERTFRSLGGDVAGACDPLGRGSCGQKLDPKRRDGLEGPETHRSHCLACRTFGSTAMKGRAAFRDFYPWATEPDSAQGRESTRQANRTETRNGVSINRISGAVENGPFEQEVVPVGASFWGEVALSNFQIWQLGLLALAFDELNDGFAQLGSTKSRGFGAVRVAVESILFHQAAGRPALAGVGALLQDRRILSAYGLFSDRSLDVKLEEDGLTSKAVLDAQGAQAALATAKRSVHEVLGP